MKRTVVLVLLIALMVGAGAIVPAGAQDDDGVFRVAAVSPSATNDLAFSQSMYDALVMLDEEMGDAFEFTFQDGTFVVDDAAVALREWAASGEYDLVIAHGSQFGAVVEELANEFPEQAFAWGTDVNTFGLDNVYAYEAASQEGGYVNGVMAAIASESGVIGVVGPIEVGDAKLYVDGFKAGVASIDPEIEVIVNYIQSFSDTTLATEAANTMIAADADVLTGTAQMVVGPIAVSQENGVAWFGTQASQADLAAEVGMAFQIYRWDTVLRQIMEKVAAGQLGGEFFTLTLANGGLVMEYTENLDPALMEAAEQTVAAIIAGEIVPLPELMDDSGMTAPEPTAEPMEEPMAEGTAEPMGTQEP